PRGPDGYWESVPTTGQPRDGCPPFLQISPGVVVEVRHDSQLGAFQGHRGWGPANQHGDSRVAGGAQECEFSGGPGPMVWIAVSVLPEVSRNGVPPPHLHLVRWEGLTTQDSGTGFRCGLDKPSATGCAVVRDTERPAPAADDTRRSAPPEP